MTKGEKDVINIKKLPLLFIPSLALLLVTHAHAENWSDTSVGVRWGNNFKEPNNPRTVNKTIWNLTHLSGDKWGRNVAVVDVLVSNSSDPAAGGEGGATEFYGFYRRNVSLSAVTGNSLENKLIKDINLTGRIDLGTKNSDLAPRPRKLRVGISADLPVKKGYAEIGVDAYKENQHNGITNKNFSFDTTYALWLNAGMPVGERGNLSGFVDFIGAQGKDGFGQETKPSTLVRVQYMHNLGKDKDGFKVGVGYEYFRNKYSNDNQKDSFKGSTHSTPLLLAEYHF